MWGALGLPLTRRALGLPLMWGALGLPLMWGDLGLPLKYQCNATLLSVGYSHFTKR